MAFIAAPDPNQPGSALFDPATLGHASAPGALGAPPAGAALAALSGFGRVILSVSRSALAAPQAIQAGGGSVGYPH